MLRKHLVRASALVALGIAVPVAGADEPKSGPVLADDSTEAENHLVVSQVHFDFDSADLSDSGRAALDKAAEWIRLKHADVILIEGHADRVGEPPYNKRLAERRAAVARGHLLSRGVEEGRIRILSYGEGLPVMDTEKRSRENRRIVLMAVQKEPIVETETRTEVVKLPVEKKIYIDRLVEVPAPRPVRRPLGIEVLAGGGVTGFIDDHTTDVTDVGGMWTARVVGRTGGLVGYEAAYVGSAQGIDALGVDDNAVVLGNGIEGNVRLNLVRGARLQPYVFAGLGWTHYKVTNTDISTASIEADDDVVHLPAGAGISLRLAERVILDLRGTFRGAFDDGMFDGGTEESDGLETWSSSAQVGFSF